MAVPKFNPDEMTVVRQIPMLPLPVAPLVDSYRTPVSLAEGYVAHMKKDPYWVLMGNEVAWFVPRLLPDNVARATCFDGEGALNDKGGPDMFGVEWVFVPVTGGSIVKPGKPLLKNANEWI